MKAPEQIAEDAARVVISDNLANMYEYDPSGDPIVQLGWALGDGIEYEDGLKQLVIAAIEADRAQRNEEERRGIVVDALLSEEDVPLLTEAGRIYVGEANA